MSTITTSPALTQAVQELNLASMRLTQSSQTNKQLALTLMTRPARYQAKDKLYQALVTSLDKVDDLMLINELGFNDLGAVEGVEALMVAVGLRLASVKTETSSLVKSTHALPKQAEGVGFRLISDEKTKQHYRDLYRLAGNTESSELEFAAREHRTKPDDPNSDIDGFQVVALTFEHGQQVTADHELVGITKTLESKAFGGPVLSYLHVSELGRLYGHPRFNLEFYSHIKDIGFTHLPESERSQVITCLKEAGYTAEDLNACDFIVRPYTPYFKEDIRVGFGRQIVPIKINQEGVRPLEPKQSTLSYETKMFATENALSAVHVLQVDGKYIAERPESLSDGDISPLKNRLNLDHYDHLPVVGFSLLEDDQRAVVLDYLALSGYYRSDLKLCDFIIRPCFPLYDTGDKTTQFGYQIVPVVTDFGMDPLPPGTGNFEFETKIFANRMQRSMFIHMNQGRLSMTPVELKANNSDVISSFKVSSRDMSPMKDTTVLQVIDCSGSMRACTKVIRNVLLDTYTTFSMQPENRNISQIITFSTTPGIVLAFETRGEIKPQSGVKMEGGTALFQAIDRAVDELSGAPKDRRQVLQCMTDGEDTQSDADEANEVRDKLWRFLEKHTRSSVVLFAYYSAGTGPNHIIDGFDKESKPERFIEDFKTKFGKRFTVESIEKPSQNETAYAAQNRYQHTQAMSERNTR